MILNFELSFDRHFSHTDRIYRLNSIWIEQEAHEEMPINIREAYTITNNIQTFDPEYVMVNHFSVDICESYYTTEQRLQRILSFGSIFSVVIVLLGIYALVLHNMLNRTKEIGIRKIMGGSIRKMMSLIYFTSIKWTMLAAAVAVPLSWLYLDRWLNDYAVRIPLYWWIFVSSIALVVVFQRLITLGQTRKTARKNPVEALRYE